MDNLKICVAVATSEKSISTEPPGTDEGHFTNLLAEILVHAANFFNRLFWYDLQRIYDSELKLHLMRKYQLE